MAVVRELLTRLGFDVDRASAQKGEQAITRIRDQANDAANMVRGMLAAFVGFQGLKGLANVADTMQSLETRMGMLPQSTEGAAAAFDHVVDRANNARQSVEAYADFYIKAGNATQDFIKDQETLTKVVDGASFGLAASGATAVAQSQAFFQLGQAIGSPTVQMEEMNTLIDVAPDMFRALGQAIPGANGNLKAFISTGKVTGQMLAEGLMAILPQFQDQMRQMPMNIGTATVLMQNKFSAFVARLNRESKAVTNIANFFLDAFDAIEKSLNDLVDFLGGPTQALKLFGIALAAALAPIAIKMFVGALALLISPIGLIVAGLTLLGVAIEDFYQWVSGGESVIGSWLGPFEEWKAANSELIESLVYLWSQIQGIWDGVKALGSSIWDILVGLFTADTARLTQGFSGVLDAISQIIGSWAEGAKAMFGLLFDGLKNAFVTLWDISPAHAWLSKIGEVLGQVKQYFADAFNGVLQSVSDAALAIALQISGAFDGLLQTIKNIVPIVQGYFADMFGSAIEWVKNIGSEIVNSIQGKLSSAVGSVKGFFGFGGGDEQPQSSPAYGSVVPVAPQAAPVYGPAVPAVSPSGMGSGQPTTNNNTVNQTINLTVPPGSTSEQVSAVRDAAKQSFGASNQRLASDLATYGR